MGRCNYGWVASWRPIRRFGPRWPRPVSGLVLCGLIVSSCAGGADPGVADEIADPPQSVDEAATTSSAAAIDPAEARKEAEARAVVVTTTSCGDAGKAIGSGVAISPTHILTVAHVIAGATDVRVNPAATFEAEDGQSDAEEREDAGGQRPAYPATIVAFDSLRDLALLEIDPDGWTGATPPARLPPSPPRFEVLAAEDAGTIVGGVTSGEVAFTVTEKTIIEMDEVRGTRRSRRSGYLIDAATDRGDSGAGLYAASGQLVGLLFAVSTGDNRRSWATAADELQDFLDDASVTGSFACNPDESELERID